MPVHGGVMKSYCIVSIKAKFSSCVSLTWALQTAVSHIGHFNDWVEGWLLHLSPLLSFTFFSPSFAFSFQVCLSSLLHIYIFTPSHLLLSGCLKVLLPSSCFSAKSDSLTRNINCNVKAARVAASLLFFVWSNYVGLKIDVFLILATLGQHSFSLILFQP